MIEDDYFSKIHNFIESQAIKLDGFKLKDFSATFADEELIWPNKDEPEKIYEPVPKELVHPDACSPDTFGMFDEESRYCKECTQTFPECASKCKSLTKVIAVNEPVRELPTIMMDPFYNPYNKSEIFHWKSIESAKAEIHQDYKYSRLKPKQSWSTKRFKNQRNENYYERKKK